MFKNPKMLTSFAAIAAMSALCSAEAAQAETNVDSASPNGASAEALAAATEAAAATARKRAAAANFLPIVRGRLPLLFVHAIRFDTTISAMSNKDIASKFATSVGKVFDIKKGRNFSYITAEYKPSAEDLAAAQSWIDQVGASNAKGLTASGDKQLMTMVLEQYKTGGLASAEEMAKLNAARTVTRVPKGGKSAKATKAGETEKPQTAAAGQADDLLS